MKLATIAIQQKTVQTRSFLGLTQEEFAEAMGVHPMTVSKWENGRRTMDAETMARMGRIARVFKGAEASLRNLDNILETVVIIEDYISEVESVETADIGYVKSLLFDLAKRNGKVRVYEEVFYIDTIFERLDDRSRMMLREEITLNNLESITSTIKGVFKWSFDREPESDNNQYRGTIKERIKLGERVSIWKSSSDHDYVWYIIFHDAAVVYICDTSLDYCAKWESDEQVLIYPYPKKNPSHCLDLDGNQLDHNPEDDNDQL